MEKKVQLAQRALADKLVELAKKLQQGPTSARNLGEPKPVANDEINKIVAEIVRISREIQEMRRMSSSSAAQANIQVQI